jgi:hypothetical protein
MSGFFPRQTTDFRVYEPRAFRKLTLSLVAMALITGVVVRLVRWVAHGPSASMIYLGASLALGTLVLLGMLALHLSNFTLRHWLWRAPAFALLESAAEIAVAALLIAMKLEQVGTGRAELHHLPGIAATVVPRRVAIVCGFAALLAGVVILVRRVLISRARDQRSRDTLQEELYRETPV